MLGRLCAAWVSDQTCLSGPNSEVRGAGQPLLAAAPAVVSPLQVPSFLDHEQHGPFPSTAL